MNTTINDNLSKSKLSYFKLSVLRTAMMEMYKCFVKFVRNHNITDYIKLL